MSWMEGWVRCGALGMGTVVLRFHRVRMQCCPALLLHSLAFPPTYSALK
jgi:hypothetical protein